MELQEDAPENLSCEISDVERKRQMLERQLFAEQKELIELEESRPKGLFARRKDTSARDIFIQEKKATISKLNGEITSLNNRISGLQNLSGIPAVYFKILAWADEDDPGGRCIYGTLCIRG